MANFQQLNLGRRFGASKMPLMFVGVLCWPLFWNLVLCVLSSFTIILTRKRELVALLLFFQMSCYCKSFVALLHGVVGWSAVCDCGIS